MNIAVLAGHLTSNGVVRGQKVRALVFTVQTKHSKNGTDDQEVLSDVPCVLFNPSEEVERVITIEGKGLWVCLQGRIQSSKFDTEDGRASRVCEVVAFKSQLTIVKR